MLKIAAAVIAGLLAWVLLVSVGGVILRATWPEYVAATPSMTFTLPMLFARLTISTLALVAAAGVAIRFARKAIAPAILGTILLIGFVPQHINLWDKFPIWYHLTFLLTLIPLSVLGGRLGLSVISRPTL